MRHTVTCDHAADRQTPEKTFGHIVRDQRHATDSTITLQFEP